jgi:hypothetical protein
VADDHFCNFIEGAVNWFAFVATYLLVLAIDTLKVAMPEKYIADTMCA